jgi:carbon-monoxide dehydrogenase medium subunit
MYPSRFRYEAPRAVDEALDLLRAGDGEAKVLAGGQSLVPLLKLRFASPELLVDINNLPDLAYHRVDPGGRAVPARRPGTVGVAAGPAADDGRRRPPRRRPHRP